MNKCNIITCKNVNVPFSILSQITTFPLLGCQVTSFLGLLEVSFPQLFVIEADLTSAKRIIQKQKVLVLTCFLLASKSPFSVVLERKILLKATSQRFSMVGLIYSAALCRALWCWQVVAVQVWCWCCGGGQEPCGPVMMAV